MKKLIFDKLNSNLHILLLFYEIFHVIIDCLWCCLCRQHTQPVSRSLSSPVITDAVSTSIGAVITVSFWRVFLLFCFCVRCIFSTDFPHLSLLIISCVFCVTSCPLLLTICPSPCVTWAVCCRKGLWGQLWWVQLSEPDRLVHRSTCTINLLVL